MSQESPTPIPENVPTPEQQPAPVGATAPVTETTSSPQPAAMDSEESTIGTGTSMALGCIAGTVVLIVFGLIFLALSTQV